MWQPPASPPCGVIQQALCKIAYAGAGLSAACTPQPLRVLRAVACRPCGVRALWHMSGAARMVLVSGFAVYLVCAPAHPWGLLASQHRPRGLPVRPPRGLPQSRANLAKPGLSLMRHSDIATQRNAVIAPPHCAGWCGWSKIAPPLRHPAHEVGEPGRYARAIG